MQKSDQRYLLLRFFMMSAGITIGLIVPIAIVSIYYPVIRDWWISNSLNGLYFLIPSLVVLLRWFYTTIQKRRSKE